MALATIVLADRLRRETRTAHAQLDARVDLQTITQNVGACEAYLLRFADAFLEVSQDLNWAVMEAKGLVEAKARRARYQRLLNDHANISGTAPTEVNDAGSANLAASVGILYVLEGSIHGSKIIMQALLRNEPDATTERLTFLRHEDGPPWKNFVKWMNGLPLNQKQTKDSLRFAAQTFATFERHMLS